jgi:hypothetical protein
MASHPGPAGREAFANLMTSLVCGTSPHRARHGVVAGLLPTKKKPRLAGR